MKSIVVGQDDRVGPWVCERTKGIWSSVDSVAIGLERDGQLIAGVVCDNYNGASVCLHIAGEGNWYSREFIEYCLDYAFTDLQVNKILGYVPEDNLKARKFDEHIGFEFETSISNACPGGDLIIYSMNRDQWLRKYGRKVEGTKAA